MPHARGEHLGFSGSDRERAQDLHAAFEDPAVDAVLCTRGGYGAARLLPFLDFDSLSVSGKAFLGYSDITTLHLALNRREMVTFHSPMVSSFAKERPNWVTESFLRGLAGDFSRPDAAPTGHLVRGGQAEGPVCGGCLTLLSDSLATSEAFDGNGRIVLLEDIGEKPHRIDAHLTQLRNAGVLDRAAGFVVGEFTGTDEQRDPGEADWLTTLMDRLPGETPVIVSYPFGHVEGMLTLPLGLRARIEAESLQYSG